MRSHHSATLVMVALVGALFACSRSTGSNEPSRWNVKAAKNTTDWQVKCDALCDVKAKAPTLEALCAQVKDRLGDASCEARKSVGFPAIPASAVSDAAILELTPKSGAHRAFLAVKGASGWQVGRPLGSASTFQALEATPVDVPGLEPAAVQLRVALNDANGSRERLVVCGLQGDGTPSCPVAVEVAGSASSFQQMGAGLANAVQSSGWRANVELTPTGFVAKPVAGTLPEGLAGEHAFAVR
jgi:hypothetical protein